MDFPVSLGNVLRGDGDAIDVDLVGYTAAPLNENVEAMFGISPNPEELDGDTESKLKDVASLLHSVLLSSILSKECAREYATDEEADVSTQETVARVMESEILSVEGDAEMKNLSELLRACKNLLRWYLQVFVPIKGAVLPVPLRRLQSHDMIELFLLIIQRTAGEPRNEIRQQVARQACLSLFYSTYSPIANQSHIQEAQTHLVEKLGFLDILMCLLLRDNTPPVLVALVRIVHNLLASMEGMVERVEETRTSCAKSEAPWAPTEEDVVDLRSLLLSMLMWALQATPAFPGEAGDRRSDLVVEILRIFYAIRAGKYVDTEPAMSQLISYFLKLPNSEDRAYRCKLAAITLLMDTPAEYSKQLVKSKGVLPLLAVMDIQVTQVVDITESGAKAAAALVPILSVVNKFCLCSPEFCEKVKLFLFPPEEEERFLFLAAEQAMQKKKNMDPLDAPKGRRRWKLIKLMTWPESHIKRTASELLWTVCGKDAQEFILRTGFGNAMPFLSAKELVQLPPELIS